MTKEEKNLRKRLAYAKERLDPSKREAHRSVRRAWKKNNPEKVLESARKDYAKHRQQKYTQSLVRRNQTRPLRNKQAKIRTSVLRKAAIEKLGSICIRCGFSDIRALQIDHVEGGGVRELRALGSHGVYRKVMECPPGIYQLLCANCNWIKRYEQNENQRKSISVGSRVRLNRCISSSDSLSSLLEVAQRLAPRLASASLAFASEESQHPFGR